MSKSSITNEAKLKRIDNKKIANEIKKTTKPHLNSLLSNDIEVPDAEERQEILGRYPWMRPFDITTTLNRAEIIKTGKNKVLCMNLI